MAEKCTPIQALMRFYQSIEKEEAARKRAYIVWKKPYGSWLDQEHVNDTVTYFNNNKQHQKNSEYDRLFHVKPGYEQKLHRDDRATRLGLDVRAEERVKDVPLLWSSTYGARPPLEVPTGEHIHRESVNRGFYRSRGTNLPLGSD